MHRDTQRTAPKKVLLIEAHPFVRNPLEQILRSCGHTVVALDTGEKGLRAIAVDRFDAVVCNHELPGISGLDFFSRVSRNLSNTTTILTAALAYDYLANDALNSGVAVFMEMPFKIENLVACIDRRYPEFCSASLGRHLYVTSGGQMTAISFAQLNDFSTHRFPNEETMQKTINRSGRRWKLFLNPGGPGPSPEIGPRPLKPRKRKNQSGPTIYDLY